ncbi:MAG: 4Fe-4S binding protein [Methanomassiliicoccales archaeon]|nr:4Fe-4S binding protein [Methanomassiliicoccales archaeon]
MPGECCPGKSVSKRLVVDGQEVGISGLDEIVQKGLECLDRPDIEQRDVLLRELKARNYVPESVEGSYLEAVWVYFKEQRARKLGWVEEKYHGIPREEIHWYPSIDTSKCSGCGACAKFCKRGVYTLDDQPRVTNPYRCVVSCTGCLKSCTEGALSFPTLVELREEMKKLRRKYGIISD